MKKSLAVLVLATMFIVSGCSLLTTTMDEMTYYNTYIDYVNVLSDDLDNGMNDYLSYVPESVTADMDVQFYGSYYGTATVDLSDARTNLFVESMTIEDTVKETALESIAESYFTSFETFFEKYNEAATYYGNGTYKTDIESAVKLDEEIINAYYDASDLQTTLFNTISEYQISARGELDENTTDPVEKVGVAITVLSDKVDTVAEAVYNWDFSMSDTTEITALYNDLVTKHTEEKTATDALYDDKYKDLLDSFNTTYLGTLTSFESEVNKFIQDVNSGVATLDNSSDYDMIFEYYDQMIDAHNSMVDMLELYY
ncbi:MAG: DUF3829 domain-containing protein [Candidatus Gracilibacteria bacterium]|jgi:hypothetical protein